jgi:hypothetical protein
MVALAAVLEAVEHPPPCRQRVARSVSSPGGESELVVSPGYLRHGLLLLCHWLHSGSPSVDAATTVPCLTNATVGSKLSPLPQAAFPRTPPYARAPGIGRRSPTQQRPDQLQMSKQQHLLYHAPYSFQRNTTSTQLSILYISALQPSVSCRSLAAFPTRRKHIVSLAHYLLFRLEQALRDTSASTPNPVQAYTDTRIMRVCTCALVHTCTRTCKFLRIPDYPSI